MIGIGNGRAEVIGLEEAQLSRQEQETDRVTDKGFV